MDMDKFKARVRTIVRVIVMDKLQHKLKGDIFRDQDMSVTKALR